MTGWVWPQLDDVLFLHEAQRERHGGPSGVRDIGMVESALARPINRAAYGDPDAAELAAALAFGLARNHGFVDGNKRIAWIVAVTFLRANDVPFAFETGDAIAAMLALAAGELSEAELADWFRERIAAPA